MSRSSYLQHQWVSTFSWDSCTNSGCSEGTPSFTTCSFWEKLVGLRMLVPIIFKNIIPPAVAPKIGFKNKWLWAGVWQLNTWEWYWIQTKSLSWSCIFFPFFLEKEIWRPLLMIMSYIYGKKWNNTGGRVVFKYVRPFAVIFPRWWYSEISKFFFKITCYKSTAIYHNQTFSFTECNTKNKAWNNDIKFYL